jgi:hypothetical protein
MEPGKKLGITDRPGIYIQMLRRCINIAIRISKKIRVRIKEFKNDKRCY